MKKPKTLGKLKKELWKLFSLYIKLKYSKDGEHVNCFTCGKLLKIGTSDCQGGHCLPKGGYGGLYFNENNVRVQCYHCNINLSGNTAVFIHELKKEIGEDEYELMYNSRHITIKRTRTDYLELIEKYKSYLDSF